jgi:uncharacterized protein (DUF1330 family)
MATEPDIVIENRNGPAMISAGGRFLARGIPAHTLEDASELRTTLIEFPTVEAAIAAYSSAPYQHALAVLGDAARREIRIIEGVTNQPSAAS